MNSFEIDQLKRLYQTSSKHSNYQILPCILKTYFSEHDIVTSSRFEEERMTFFKKHVNFQGKKVLDIGGNTGYFSFEALAADAKEVVYYDGNSAHAKFVHGAAKALHQNITVKNEYLDFDTPIPDEPFDVVFLLNVLHHFGDDYGNAEATKLNAKIKMTESIRYFSGRTSYLILQIGFCWKGNRTQLLFDHGTKKEMIDFIHHVLPGKWDIVAIGIAEDEAGKTVYKELNDNNIVRNDYLGEFRNRPIFILKSLSHI